MNYWHLGCVIALPNTSIYTPHTETYQVKSRIREMAYSGRLQIVESRFRFKRLERIDKEGLNSLEYDAKLRLRILIPDLISMG